MHKVVSCNSASTISYWFHIQATEIAPRWKSRLATSSLYSEYLWAAI